MAKITMKLGDMTVNLRSKICKKHANCTDCPFSIRVLSLNLLPHACDLHYWYMFPDAEIELDKEELK